MSTHIDPRQDTDFRFHPISAPRAHEEVVDQIVYAIRSGLLAPGDRLPSIERVAELTDVSKPVVGEAVRVLRNHGVVESKRGVQGGVTVVSDEIPLELMRMAPGWRDAALTELVEARKPIELELALLAGERATDQELADMRTTIGRLEEAMKSGNGTDGRFISFDHQFHYQIGRAARSEMLAYYQHRILGEIAAVLSEYKLYHQDIELVVRTHTAFLDAIAARDTAAIRHAVDEHWVTSDGSFASLDAITPS